MKKNLPLIIAIFMFLGLTPITLSYLSIDGRAALQQVSKDDQQILVDNARALDVYTKYVIKRGKRMTFNSTIEGYAAYGELKQLAESGNAFSLRLFIKATRKKVLSDVIVKNESNILQGKGALNADKMYSEFNVISAKIIASSTNAFMDKATYLEKYRLYRLVKQDSIISYSWSNELLISVLLPFHGADEEQIIFNDMYHRIYSKFIPLSREWIVYKVKFAMFKYGLS